MKKILLASSSPRRIEMLKRYGDITIYAPKAKEIVNEALKRLGEI